MDKIEMAPIKDEVADWLEEAADQIANWGAYASQYFQEKWHLTEDVALFRARAATVRDPQADLTPTREPQPLTDAQIDAIFYENHTVKDHPWINWRRFARAVLAAQKDLK